MDSYYNKNSYYGGSSAYDLSMFAPTKTVERRAMPAAKPARKTASKSRTAKVVNAAAKSYIIANKAVFIRYIAIAAVAVVTLTLLVVGQSQKHELNAQIDDAKTRLVELQQDYEAMKAQYDTIMSDSAVEKYAVDLLGMQKRENSQTEYIAIGRGDIYEISDRAAAGNTITDGLEELMSYMD